MLNIENEPKIIFNKKPIQKDFGWGVNKLNTHFIYSIITL